MAARRSITRPVSISGTGLHTGAEVTLTAHPAEAATGIIFRRTDIESAPTIPATLDAVIDVGRRTSIGNDEASIQTVEHILAAVAAHAIDDLRIDVSGPEPPGGDGSAGPFFRALADAGVTEVGGMPVRHTVSSPLVVRQDGAVYIIAPADRLRLTVTLHGDHPAIGRQSGSYEVSPETFAEELADARTYGFEEEVEELRARGLARGASKANTIVLSRDGGVRTDLRWPDEFVRHKATDLLGDLALLGGRLTAEVVAFKPSHRGNIAMARAIKRTDRTSAPEVMGIPEILDVLPHRYPMLLVDRIVEMEPGKRIVGIKNVTINEPFFQGHFPGHPIMPGVLIVEAMAQTGGIMLMGEVDEPETKIVYFMSIDKVKFRRPVVPGDQLRLEVEMLQFRGRTCRMRGVGYVDGQPVAEAEMMARVVDR